MASGAAVRYKETSTSLADGVNGWLEGFGAMVAYLQQEPTRRPLALTAALATITVALSMAVAALLSRGSVGRYQMVSTGESHTAWRIDTETGRLSFCIPRPSPTGLPIVAACGPWGDAPLVAPVAEARQASPPLPPFAEPPLPRKDPSLLEEPTPPQLEDPYAAQDRK